MTKARRRELADRAVKRRAFLGKWKTCLNGAHHGPATHGRRCAWCALVHSRGLRAVLALEADGKAPPRPPRYTPKLRHEDRAASRAAKSKEQKRRQAENVKLRMCRRARSHGRATNGQSCAWCALVNSRGLKAVFALEAEGLAPPRPPGYKPRVIYAPDEPRVEIDDDDDTWLR